MVMKVYKPICIQYVRSRTRLFKRGCVGDGSHRSISICAYAVFYENLFHIVFKCGTSLRPAYGANQ